MRIFVRNLHTVLVTIGIGILIVGISLYPARSVEKKTSKQKTVTTKEASELSNEMKRTDEEWKKLLTEEQYRVTRQCGTEPAFTGKYYNFKGNGKYLCVCCGNELFESDTKYESGSGWPSFWEAVSNGAITEKVDQSLGMMRTEIKCGRCDAHLGHIFEDGPKPTGLRFCVNSASLKFVGDSTESKDKADKEN